MPKTLISRRALIAASLLMIYSVAYLLIATNYLIQFIAALFAGTIVAGLFVYSKLLFDAITAKSPLSHVHQMTLGIMCSWLVKMAVALYAVFSPPRYVVGLVLALALTSAYLQITAAHLGDARFYAADKLVIRTGFVVGGSVAFVIIMLQLILWG